MNVSIFHGTEGAQKAKGLAVIIDVFRASSTILACFHRNVKEIIPVQTVEEAKMLKKKHPSWILVGERRGKKVEGFDFGNSPATILNEILLNKSIIFTTSSGTKGILSARHAEEIIIASFTNISEVVSYIKEKNFNFVSLVPMGLNATEPALEDDFCAETIRNRLFSYQKESDHSINSIIKNSEGMKRLNRLGQQDDIEYCLQQDLFPYIPVYNKEDKIITVKQR